METRWQINWFKYEHGGCSFLRANLWAHGVISITDLRIIMASGWELRGQPYDFCHQSVYYFVRIWEPFH